MGRLCILLGMAIAATASTAQTVKPYKLVIERFRVTRIERSSITGVSLAGFNEGRTMTFNLSGIRFSKTAVRRGSQLKLSGSMEPRTGATTIASATLLKR